MYLLFLIFDGSKAYLFIILLPLFSNEASTITSFENTGKLF